jgi:arsenate reductase
MDNTMPSERPYNVLFLCTGNSARSIIGEVLMNHDGAGRFKAYSAGSHPKGDVHPMALATLAGLGFNTEGLRSNAGTSSPARARPRSISSSPSVTTQRGKRARSGSAIR